MASRPSARQPRSHAAAATLGRARPTRATQTALGATIFFWARLAHALIYISGVWQLRALAYFAAVAGGLLILVQLV